jgi:hypothetical protein
MHDTWAQQLDTWHEFYLLIGTAGVTLTGLLFVVVSLGPHVVRREHTTGVRAFVSPNAVLFTSALVVSAVLIAPGLSETVIGWLLCLGSVASLGYLAHTRAHQQWRKNRLSVLDWIWYIAMPMASYLLLLLSGIGVLLRAAPAMHAVAAALILLLVTGIRNAWDLVVWIAEQENLPLSADDIPVPRDDTPAESP